MGITLLILAIIAIVVGISVKEYLQNKSAEEKQKAIEQAPAPTPVEANLHELAHNEIQELLKEIENIDEEPVIEEPKKPKKKRYYKPKGKKQIKKQAKK